MSSLPAELHCRKEAIYPVLLLLTPGKASFRNKWCQRGRTHQQGCQRPDDRSPSIPQPPRLAAQAPKMHGFNLRSKNPPKSIIFFQQWDWGVGCSNPTSLDSTDHQIPVLVRLGGGFLTLPPLIEKNWDLMICAKSALCFRHMQSSSAPGKVRSIE